MLHDNFLWVIITSITFFQFSIMACLQLIIPKNIMLTQRLKLVVSFAAYCIFIFLYQSDEIRINNFVSIHLTRSNFILLINIFLLQIIHQQLFRLQKFIEGDMRIKKFFTYINFKYALTVLIIDVCFLEGYLSAIFNSLAVFFVVYLIHKFITLKTESISYNQTIVLISSIFVVFIGLAIAVSIFLFGINDILQKVYSQIFTLTIFFVCSMLFLGLLHDVFKTYADSRQLQQIAKISELHAYRTLINPHSIQNVFNLMSRSEARKLGSSLMIADSASAYFSNVAGKANVSIVSLSEEIENLREYLELNKALFPRVFDFKISISENLSMKAMMQGVPFMLLQPIAENSIIHGFRNMHEGGEIKVNLHQEGKWVFIEVRDNGSGFDESKSTTVNNSWCYQLIKKRLSIMFDDIWGKGHSMFLENNKDGKGAKCCICFKMSNKNERYFKLGSC